MKPDDLAGIEAAIRPGYPHDLGRNADKLLLKLADLAAIADIASPQFISVADNTFASPLIHRPS